MSYALRASDAKAEQAELRVGLAAIAVLGALAGGLWLWLYPAYSRAKAERSFVWSVVFSDERITSRFGRVKDAHMERDRSPSGRRSRDAHLRKETGDLVEGTVALLVIGEKGAGKALISYSWNYRSGEHGVTSIELLPF